MSGKDGEDAEGGRISGSEAAGDAAHGTAAVLATADNKLAPFNPTCDECIDAAFEMADIHAGDTMLDVGCGDGRLLVKAAVEFGIACVGLEYDAKFVDRAVRAAEAASVAHLVTVRHVDALAETWPACTVVFIYLTPSGIARARPQLDRALDGGARIAASIFSVPGWTPVATRRARGLPVYLYKKQAQGDGCEAGEASEATGASGAGSGRPASDGAEGGGEATAGASAGDGRVVDAGGGEGGTGAASGGGTAHVGRGGDREQDAAATHSRAGAAVAESTAEGAVHVEPEQATRPGGAADGAT